MRRRDFLKQSAVGIATAATVRGGSLISRNTPGADTEALAAAESLDTEIHARQAGQILFPALAPHKRWTRFAAAGMAQPACGIIYTKADPVEHGMPLGGIATGALDVNTDGTFGYCNLFNSGVPTRGPMGYSFLGLSSGGRTWILSTREMTGIENASDIRYWGHYPVADLEYTLDAPFRVALRAWTPFLPGDAKLSNIPAAVFEVHVRNDSAEVKTATLAFSFPGPTQAEAQISPTSQRQMRYIDGFPVSDAVSQGTVAARRRTFSRGGLEGLEVSSPAGTEYVIGVLGAEKPRFGGGLTIAGYDYATGQQWVQIAHGLSKAAPDDFDASTAVDFHLAPGEEKVVRFVLAWYSPIWKGDEQRHYQRMYAREYTGAAAVAQAVARDHTALLQRVLNWQEAVYTAEELPVPLREALVNILHLITKTGYWAVAQAPIGSWCKQEDGLFGMSECPRECPQIECIPCSFYGNVALVYFFPELALSTLRGYKAYQYENGAPPWVFGGCTAGAAEGYHATDPCDMTTPSPGYQNTLNAPCYIDMLDRYWQRTGDDAVLQEFYESAKKAVVYTIGLRPGPEGIVSVPAGNRNPTQPHTKPGGGLDWFEGNGWYGMTPHVGGIHLAMLRMVQRMAERMNDQTFARQCAQWIEQGSQEMESKLWAGDYYLSYYEPESGKKSDLVFGYQLDGNWMTQYHGLPGVFRDDRVPTVLNKIKNTCMAINKYGAANFALPQAKAADPKDFSAWGVGYGAHGYFPPEVYMLGAIYLYNGDRATGLKLVVSCLEGISVKYGYTWQQPNVVSGDTGKRVYGADYYQNMILWAVPAALDSKDIKAATSGGGLVDRVINAARQA